MSSAERRVTCVICGRVVSRDKRTGRIPRHGHRGGAGMGGGGCPTSGYNDMKAAVENAIVDAKRALEQKH